MQYLVFGVGTDIGKTFFVENFCHKNSQFMAIKPIASGFKDDDKNSDPARILLALNRKVSPENLDEVSPWRFEMAASPHIAAKSSEQEIDFVELKNFCLEKIRTHAQLLIEGAGGVMTPINDSKTFLDLAVELKVPVLLITANYLGSISHTLCAVAALQAKQISIEAILVNEFVIEKNNSMIATRDLVESLCRLSGCKVFQLEKFLEKVS